jgi:curved DNA-binding protein CbpA
MDVFPHPVVMDIDAMHAKVFPRPDIFDVLGVPGNCTASELRRAYLEFVKLYHPDGYRYSLFTQIQRGPADSNAEREHRRKLVEIFEAVTPAYEMLMDAMR